MKLKYEFIAEALTNAIGDKIREHIMFDGLKELDIDLDKVVDTMAVNALLEIQQIIKNDKLSDFDVVEQIVGVFEKYKISTGTRHDF